MSHVSISLFSLIAFALLAMAMGRHQKNLFGLELATGPTRALRSGGWAALAASLTIAVNTQGWSLGLVAWCGHISLAAGLVILALIAWERRKAL